MTAAAFTVSTWGRSLYRGDSRIVAHLVASQAARDSEVMGECILLLGDGQLTTYRRGPDGVERKDY